MTQTPSFRPGQRLRHTGRNSIVLYGYGYMDGDLDMNVVVINDRNDEDNGLEITCETSVLKPATAVAPVPAAILAELADWMENAHEDRGSDLDLIESISYKLRTLAGEDLTQTDILPVDGAWPSLQRAMDRAEHHAGGGCDTCPEQVDPYARIAELETERDRAANDERVKIVKGLTLEADRVRNDARAAGRNGSYAGLVAGIIDLLADRLNDRSI